MNAYEILGLPVHLVLADGDLADAYREAGKTLHPDAGGTPEGFAALRDARATLASPSRRLRHWLDLTNRSVELRGTIDGPLMEVFSEVGKATQQAEELIRKREASTSALGRAMLENATQQCRERIEAMIEKVDLHILAECADFPVWETSENLDLNRCGTCARNLAFLEKWRVTLRACFSRLV